MRIQSSIIPFVLASGALLANWLFNGAELGLNLVIFCAFLCLQLFHAKRSKSFNYLGMAGAAVCLLLSLTGVALHGTDLGIMASFVAVLVLLGYRYGASLRQPILALLNGITTLMVAPFRINWLTGVSSTAFGGSIPWRRMMLYTRISIFPILITILFYLLYISASDVFLTLTFGWIGDFFDWISYALRGISWTSLGLLILGAVLTAAFALGYLLDLFGPLETALKDEAQRKRNSSRSFIKTLALKYEARSGIIMLTLLNLLLFTFHLVDIPSVWWDYKVEGGRYFASVHNGVYILIFCICMSMLVLLYYFSGNQHFYRKNGPLRLLSYLWLAQNLLLVVSVAIRDHWYIYFDGLSYKRIGVIVYLLMTVAGLISLYWKIAANRSLSYVIKLNSWFAFLLLSAGSLVNWDYQIARNNLSHWETEAIDYTYLLTLSDRTLPAFLDNYALLPAEVQETVASMSQRREAKLGDRDWRSWNRSDSRTYKRISEFEAHSK